MSRRERRNPGRPTRRWTFVAIAAGTLAVAVVVRALVLRPAPLEPLPAVSLAAADRQVKLLLEQAQKNVQQDPRSAMAWGDLGGALRAHEFGPEAEVCFRNAERLDPSDYRWPYLLAVSLATTDADRALASLRRSAGLAGDRPHVHLRLADALLDQNLLDEAAVVVEHVLALAPSDARAQFVKARLLLAQGNLAESRNWCERSISTAADKRAPRLLLAQLCRRLGDPEGEAREMSALKSIPEGVTEWDDPDVAAVISLRRDRGWQLMAADELAASGRSQEAAGLLAAIAGDGDRSGEATAMLVQTLLREGQSGPAEQILREKIAQDPQSERLHFQLGIVLFSLKNYEAAASEFRRTIELKPDNADAHYNLGHALRKAQREKEALEAFAATIRLQPGHAFARANLAELLLDSGNADEARTHLKVAARLAPGDPKVRELLARLPPSTP